MSPAEKWNSFSSVADPILALLIFSGGLTAVFLRNRFAAARATRVATGELSLEQARAKAKTADLCSYLLLGCGLLLLAVEIFGS